MKLLRTLVIPFLVLTIFVSNMALTMKANSDGGEVCDTTTFECSQVTFKRNSMYTGVEVKEDENLHSVNLPKGEKLESYTNNIELPNLEFIGWYTTQGVPFDFDKDVVNVGTHLILYAKYKAKEDAPLVMYPDYVGLTVKQAKDTTLEKIFENRLISYVEGTRVAAGTVKMLTQELSLTEGIHLVEFTIEEIKDSKFVQKVIVTSRDAISTMGSKVYVADHIYISAKEFAHAMSTKDFTVWNQRANITLHDLLTDEKLESGVTFTGTMSAGDDIETLLSDKVSTDYPFFIGTAGFGDVTNKPVRAWHGFAVVNIYITTNDYITEDLEFSNASIVLDKVQNINSKLYTKESWDKVVEAREQLDNILAVYRHKEQLIQTYSGTANVELQQKEIDDATKNLENAINGLTYNFTQCDLSEKDCYEVRFIRQAAIDNSVSPSDEGMRGYVYIEKFNLKIGDAIPKVVAPEINNFKFVAWLQNGKELDFDVDKIKLGHFDKKVINIFAKYVVVENAPKEIKTTRYYYGVKDVSNVNFEVLLITDAYVFLKGTDYAIEIPVVKSHTALPKAGDYTVKYAASDNAITKDIDIKVLEWDHASNDEDVVIVAKDVLMTAKQYKEWYLKNNNNINLKDPMFNVMAYNISDSSIKYEPAILRGSSIDLEDALKNNPNPSLSNPLVIQDVGVLANVGNTNDGTGAYIEFSILIIENDLNPSEEGNQGETPIAPSNPNNNNSGSLPATGTHSEMISYAAFAFIGGMITLLKSRKKK